MKKDKIITFTACIIGLCVAGFVYLNFNPIGLMRMTEKEVNRSELDKNPQISFTGKKAGTGIEKLISKEQVLELSIDDYVVIEVFDIIPTGIYELNHWVRQSDYNISTKKRSRNRSNKKYLNPHVNQKPKFNDINYYTQYYLLKLQDGTYIPALFDRCYVSSLKKGKKTVLPIASKIKTNTTVKGWMESIAKDYPALIDDTFYMFEDEWYQQNKFSMLVIKAVAAILVFFIINIGIISIFSKKSSNGKENRT